MSIPQFSADTSPRDINAALSEAGCAVVTGVMDAELRQSITDELAPHMANARLIEEDDPTQFYPGRTRRVSALVARSPSVTDHLVAHPLSLQVCETQLLPNCEYGYQLHVSAALDVGPARASRCCIGRRVRSRSFPCRAPTSSWPACGLSRDFRADNGATLLVPGSHRWPADRQAAPGRDSERGRCRPVRCCSGWVERCTARGRTRHETGATE